MKKLLYTIIILLLVAGCKKDDAPPVVVPPDKDPVISATATTLNPDYKGTCTVSWEVTGIYQTFVVSLNGSQISTEAKSSYKIDSVSENINFYFVCTTKSGKQITKNLGISPKSPPPPVLPKINSFTVDHSTVEAGLPIMLNWNISCSKSISLTIKPLGKPETTNDGLDSIGTFPYIPKENTIFILKAFNANGEVTDTLKVVVTLPPPPPTNTELVCQSKGWIFVKTETRFSESDPWLEVSLAFYAELRELYHADGRYEVFRVSNGELIGNGPWFFFENETKINFGGMTREIVSLTQSIFVFIQKEVCIGCSGGSFIYVRYTCVPATKK